MPASVSADCAPPPMPPQMTTSAWFAARKPASAPWPLPFVDTTLRNLAANDGRIAISIYDAKTLEGYQIRGTAEHVTEGAVVTTFKALVEQMFQGAATAKGALIITPETVIVTTPGAENKKVL